LGKINSSLFGVPLGSVDSLRCSSFCAAYTPPLKPPGNLFIAFTIANTLSADMSNGETVQSAKSRYLKNKAC
jgi:hypothetical protein